MLQINLKLNKTKADRKLDIKSKTVIQLKSYIQFKILVYNMNDAQIYGHMERKTKPKV